MAKELAIGDKAPDFTLPSQSGDTVSLKQFRGRFVVLYFYPKDDTPGCTKEACEFRDADRTVSNLNAVVLGVSREGAASHQKFIAKYSLPFTLLSDEETEVCQAYGVFKEKSMYGKTYWGIERGTFVIDPEGKVKGIFRKVKVDGHVDAVLSVLKA
jgi:peroxiredoxin Q/BCP